VGGYPPVASQIFAWKDPSMTSADLLLDAFGRIRETVEEAVLGLTPAQLAYRPDPGANSVGWLLWHLARIQDDHIADAAQTEQVWTSGQWAERFGLPPGSRDTGYGHEPDAVAVVRPESSEVVLAYYDAVHEKTMRYVAGLTEDDYGRIVDKHWDPPVTLAVRLVSVISDNLQHAGQAAYLRGLIERGADERSS
jgi:Protein of unknown function (DUF664)